MEKLDYMDELVKLYSQAKERGETGLALDILIKIEEKQNESN